ITPEAISSHPLPMQQHSDGSWQVRHKVDHSTDTVLRLRGYTENRQGQRYYFYTNPLRFTR
ncbi:hypothetical protein, partial [Rheinheimera nanhaiensis]|uniref:hypothetical protein n=1 Tax=Rheinheimera nanhaiensis TaxID=1163621 RepID=UPI00058D42CD